MSKRIVNKTLSAAIVAALYASAGYAQQPPAAATTTELDTVIVTGSYIRTTVEDPAIPVDVVTAEDLEKQGSPTMIQLVKTITSSQAAIGESNRYNVGAGTAQINLRGFGAGRTLVLMNNRRLADNPIAAGQNLNFIPTAAIGRVDILKDGAASTYGSEAVGGVVNFITRRDLNGLELNGDYSHIDGSNGDYEASAAWGSKTNTGNVLFTVGYRHRSRLDINERDWARTGYEDANYGGWTGAGNPGVYVTNSVAGTALFRDNGCAELGGQLTAANGSPVIGAPLATSTCRFQFSTFNDIVNREDHYQIFGEINSEISDGIQFHTEVAWGRDNVPEQRLSPANTNTQFPTPTTLGGQSGSTATPGALNAFVRYNVPANNPGLLDLQTTCATNPVAFVGAANCASLAAPGGVDISQTGWRAIAFAGHPTNADKADHQVILTTEFRVSSGLKGEFHGINWDTAMTYMNARSDVDTNDLVVDRIQLALNGFGSLNGAADACTAADRAVPANAGNAAVGCYFFNPFTNSVAVSAVNGQANPFYRGAANPAVVNNPQLVEWLYGAYRNVYTNDIFTVDGVLSGKTGLHMWGDEIAWALGTQYRYTHEQVRYGDLFNNKTTPCVDSAIDRTNSTTVATPVPPCGAPNGPLIFFGSNSNTDVSRSVYAFFGELNLPILDTLEARLAVRYESYPGEIGSTWDPKFSLSWKALDWFNVHASAGTTFRAPSTAATTPGCTTGVANIGGTYRAVQTCGNPSEQPETARDYNVGVTFTPGDLKVSLDYYLFKFKDELTTETAAQLYAAMFPGNTNVNCGVAALAPLQARFLFAGGTCGAANVLRIDSLNVNGPSVDTSGFDFRAQYDWGHLFGGSASVGLDATYLKDYRRGAFTLNGASSIAFAPATERAGTQDLVSQFFSYPRVKANIFAAYTVKDLTVRWQTRFAEGTRPAVGTPATRWEGVNGVWVAAPLGKTSNLWQHDLVARWSLPTDTVLTFAIQNVMDKNPPDAPSQYNYDYTSGNPLGRVFKLGIKQKF